MDTSPIRPQSYRPKNTDLPNSRNWPKASVDQVGNLIAEHVEVKRVLRYFESYTIELEHQITLLRKENEFLLRVVDEYENPE